MLWSSHWLIDRRRRRLFTALEPQYLNDYDGKPIGKTVDMESYMAPLPYGVRIIPHHVYAVVETFQN